MSSVKSQKSLATFPTVPPSQPLLQPAFQEITRQNLPTHLGEGPIWIHYRSLSRGLLVLGRGSKRTKGLGERTLDSSLRLQTGKAFSNGFANGALGESQLGDRF
jgi:hypothetical protein